MFGGREPMVTTEQQMAMEICRKHDAVEAGQEPYEHWRKNRYVAFSAQWQKVGYFNDTIEITGNWSALLKRCLTRWARRFVRFARTCISAPIGHISIPKVRVST